MGEKNSLLEKKIKKNVFFSLYALCNLGVVKRELFDQNFGHGGPVSSEAELYPFWLEAS